MSHPIQYQVSLLRKITLIKNIELDVFYYWRFGVDQSYDKEFNAKIKWDLPLLSGYSYKFLRNIAWRKNTSFFGCINFGVVQKIFSKKYNVVLIFGWALFSNWLVIGSALICNTPIMLVSESPYCHEKFKVGIRGKIRRKILEKLFKYVDLFLYIGEENRLFYKSFDVPDSKLRFCPYAVDNDRHLGRLSDGSGSFKKDNTLMKGAQVILFVGKLISKKRPLDLIRAFTLLISNMEVPHSIELWMVGDGGLRNECEKFLEDHEIKSIKIWGFKNQLDLPKFYEAADIFVLPSGYGETWGLVINEAMCYSKPIITSDLVGCATDLVRPNNGLIFRCGNIEDLTACLKTLVNSPGIRKNFGIESLKIIKRYNQDYSAKCIIDGANYLSESTK